MEELSIAQRIAVWILPVLFAVTVHEIAHGWAALRLGDRTALVMGRLTLNPLRHIDPVGSIALPFALLAFGAPFVFGWAKPVPVAFGNLYRPRRDMILVALAGPAANLLMALAWAGVMKVGALVVVDHFSIGMPLLYMGAAGILINVVLMLFNLLPLPPLDGGRVLVGLLPDRLAAPVARIEPFGFVILIALILTGLLGKVMGPALTTTVERLIFSYGLESSIPIFNNLL